MPEGSISRSGQPRGQQLALKARGPLELDRTEAGLPGIRFHDLRHFCATQLLELGVDRFAVSIQLGHTDGGALVMARYGHPSKDAARARLLAAFDVGAGESGSPARSTTTEVPGPSGADGVVRRVSPI